MSEARENFVERTKFVFDVPPWPASLCGSLVMAALAGAVGFGTPAAGVGGGLLLIGVPALVGAAFTPTLDRGRGGGTFDAGQSSLLVLACTTLIAAFIIGASVIQSIMDASVLSTIEMILLASVGIVTFRLIVMVSVSGPPLSHRLVPASIHSGVAVLAVVAVSHPSLTTIVVTLVCAVCYASIAVGLVVYVDYPLRRDWGVSGFEFVHQFLEYIAGQPSELESYFTRLGEPVEMPVTVLSFRRPSGGVKARVVSTPAHPGPFAGIGGGTLPYRLAESGPGLTFIPHGMADHDYNPTSEAGVLALCDAADRALDNITDDECATPARQREEEPTLTGQAFGDGALVVSTFAPQATDDIHYAVGRAAAIAAWDVGIENPLLIDAHNCQFAGDTDGRTVPGSERAQTLTDGVERMAAALTESDRGRLRVGVAEDTTPWGTEEGIGPLGIRALATEVEGTTAIYLLVDGNNMVAGLRDTIRDALDGDIVEVLTTDSHAVNHLSSANYVGANIDTNEFVSLAETVATAAIDDLEPVAAGTATANAELTVFGEDTVENLTAYGDRILPRCGIFIAVATAVVTAIAVVLF